jgi:putative ABC transport system permease protein
MLTPRDVFAESIAALRAHYFRAALAASGLVVGVATIVTALAIGDGARRAATSEIGALGVTNLFVRRTQPAESNDKRRTAPASPLTLGDARAIAALPGVVQVATTRGSKVDAVGAGRSAQVPLVGASRSWDRYAGVSLASGRWLSADDERGSRRVAVVGASIAAELLGGRTSGRIRAAGDWFTVIGVLTPRGTGRQALAGIDVDRALVVPMSAMDVSLGADDRIDRVDEIALTVGGAGEVERVAALVRSLVERRRIGEDVDVVVPRELLAARLRARRTFDVVLLALGALSLLISGIGIMNIMVANVTERTPEIGVRRAVGATRRDILAQFAAEATLLCVAGGAAGVPLGGVAAAVVSAAAGWPVAISPASIALALLLAIGVGLGFGLYPARAAAAVQPIDALRAI